MKAALLLSLGINIGIGLQAQSYLHWPQLSATWVDTRYTVVPFPPPAHYFLESVTPYCQTLADTLINGITYNQLYLCVGGYKGALRDDNDRIYYVPGDSTQEYLLYDFNLEAGDTAFNVYYEANGMSFLSEPLTIAFAEPDPALQNRKVQTLETGVRWIQGIGSAWGIFTEPWVNISDYQLRLECMSNSDTLLFPEEVVGTQGSCDWNMGLLPSERPDALTIAPNPTEGPLQFAVAPASARTVEFVNVLGERALVRTYAESIDVGPLPAGTYALIVRDAQGNSLACTRILKR